MSTPSIENFFGRDEISHQGGEALAGKLEYESTSIIAFEPSIGAAVMEVTVWEGGVGQSVKSEKQPASRYMLAQLGIGVLGVIKMFSSPGRAKSALVAMKADAEMANVPTNLSSHGMG